MLLDILKDKKLLTRRDLFEAIGGEETITWHAFKRVLGGAIAEKLIASTVPAFSKSLHSRYSLTEKGQRAVDYDVINLTTGEVLKENMTRSEAIKFAAHWSDANKYTNISIDDANREVTIKE